jgi:beta-N-acetylhexosaminidase
VIRDVVRRRIGFDGLLMTDDLSMKALGGDFGTRARRALRAGCDMVLHCNGALPEMKAVAQAVPALKGRALRRAEAALARVAALPEPFDPVEGRARLEAALAALA